MCVRSRSYGFDVVSPVTVTFYALWSSYWWAQAVLSDRPINQSGVTTITVRVWTHRGVDRRPAGSHASRLWPRDVLCNLLLEFSVTFSWFDPWWSPATPTCRPHLKTSSYCDHSHDVARGGWAVECKEWCIIFISTLFGWVRFADSSNLGFFFSFLLLILSSSPTQIKSWL